VKGECGRIHPRIRTISISCSQYDGRMGYILAGLQVKIRNSKPPIFKEKKGDSYSVDMLEN